MNLCTVGSVAIVSSISETLTKPTGLEVGRFAVALLSKMEIYTRSNVFLEFKMKCSQKVSTKVGNILFQEKRF